MISNRSKKLTNTPNFIHAGWKKHHDDPFDANFNPNGMVNLGVSENKLIEKEILGKLASINYKKFNESYTHYCCLTGIKEFRFRLSQFFKKFMNIKCNISEDNVVVMNGCGTVIETLGAAICDDGEGFLVPAPYYTTFKSDLEARFNTKLFPIKSKKGDKRPFDITLPKLQNAYNEALEKGIRIRGLLISNPINPLGITYSPETLQTCLEFCYTNNVHFVCDEIYTLSVYENQSTFVNILSLKNIEKYKNIIHVVWGFSKDFALSGFRCGVAITFNEDMIKALQSTAYYTSVPTATQYVLSAMIADTEWIMELQRVNHRRLREARDLVAFELTKADIPFLSPHCGLFLSFNVAPYMLYNTFDEETELYQNFLDNGVFVLPGQVLEFSTPGWFRIIISNDSQELYEGVRRIVECLEAYSR